MPLKRGHHQFDGQFTQIPNAWIRDTRLSFKARGLLGLIMSHQEGWELTVDVLAQVNIEGKDAIRSAINELESYGYLTRRQRNNGRFGESLWITQDPVDKPVDGVADFPTTENPTTENPTTDNPLYKKTINKKTIIKKNILFNSFWEIYPRRQAMDAAEKAFNKAVRKDGLDVVMAGVEQYGNDPNLPEPEFIPMASTWLNQGRYKDPPLPPKTRTKEELDAYEAERRAQERKEKQRREQEEFSAEVERMEAQAAPPPECEHGKTIARCLICIAQQN